MTRSLKSGFAMKACLLSLSVFFASCASQSNDRTLEALQAANTPVEELNADYRILSMVTSGRENLHLQAGSRFFWLKPVELFGIEDEGRSAMFMEMINANLRAKGFVIVQSQQESDYQISALAAMGKIPEGQGYFLNPGLLDHEGENKGSLMIFIYNPPTRQLWRGAAQVYDGEGLSKQFRVERTQKAINGLLRDVSIQRR